MKFWSIYAKFLLFDFFAQKVFVGQIWTKTFYSVVFLPLPGTAQGQGQI